MSDDEIISFIKRMLVRGKKIGALSLESGVSRRTIQNILRKKFTVSLIIRARLEEYFEKISLEK